MQNALLFHLAHRGESVWLTTGHMYCVPSSRTGGCCGGQHESCSTGIAVQNLMRLTIPFEIEVEIGYSRTCTWYGYAYE